MNNEIDWRNVFIILIGFILGIFAFFIFMFAINGWLWGFLILFLSLGHSFFTGNPLISIKHSPGVFKNVGCQQPLLNT